MVSTNKKTQDGCQKKKPSPKYRIELFSKTTDEGNEKMSKVLTR